jgi:prepilin-type N-terminal cleavage/methylation domain-containing protein
MNNKKSYTAFSLIELSVVITIIALVASAALSLSVSDSNSEKIAITNQKIEKIYKAMGVYLAQNGKLPCVAPVNIVKTSSSYGVAGSCSSTPSSGSGYWQSNTYSNLYYGMIPVQTLGLPVDMAEDGFGSKFAYVILKGFTDATKFGSSDSTTTTDGSNRIRLHKKISSGTPIEVTSDAMFVIISYGPNKNGAWNAGSTTQNSASSLSEETWNYVTGNIDSPAGKADFSTYNTLSSLYPFTFSYNVNNFDDILFYKTRTEMVHDFKLYALLPCAAQTISSYAYPQASYGEIIASTTSCASYAVGPRYPAKRCGAFGTWETHNVWDCTS